MDNRNATPGAFLQLLAGPTLLTMFISGLWHGAGYGFVLWGLLHGLYLSINHAWRVVGSRLWSSQTSYIPFKKPTGFVLTFLSVVFAMVLFRSPTFAVAADLYKGMLGFNGLMLPGSIVTQLGAWIDTLQPIISISSGGTVMELAGAIAWVAALSAIALMLPNSLQLLARYEPAIGVRERPETTGRTGHMLAWAPTIPWAVATSVLIAASIIRMGGKSEFLYWQF